MYLKLEAIQPRTEEWIKRSWKAGKWSPNAIISADGAIIDPRMKGGLIPTPLTRDLTWGVPVPIRGEDTHGMKGKVLCKSPLHRHKSYHSWISELDVWVGNACFSLIHLF